MHNRRNFLKDSALVSLSPLLPAFLPRTLLAEAAARDDRMLVVIQLSGGNDGLNTLVPRNNDDYKKHRNTLRIEDRDIIGLTDDVGLHPAMRPCAELFQNGHLTIAQGVGYPNPNRSHFESMDIWHSARMDAADRTGQGWLGRAAEADPRKPAVAPDAVFIGDSAMPVALRGRRANPVSLNREEELRLFASVRQPTPAPSSDDLTAFVQQTVATSYSAAQRFAESNPTGDAAVYPNSNLGRKLQLLSRIIKLGGGTRIFYTSQNGYDTHSDQAGLHSQLLRTFSNALSAFLKDMGDSGLADRIVVLAFSEFGRRVRENGSAGTDHGTAGPVFVAGHPVQGGLLGTYPSLTALDAEGDLKMTLDFRCLYSSLLQDWLNVDPLPILDGSYDRPRLIRS